MQKNEMALLPFWERLLLTVGGMMLVSFPAGLLWNRLFGFVMPAYVSGIVGV